MEEKFMFRILRKSKYYVCLYSEDATDKIFFYKGEIKYQDNLELSVLLYNQINK